MPSPKDGKACTLIAPSAPDKPEDADEADPGKVGEIKAEQRKTQKGKYGSTQVKPAKPPETQEEKETKTSWIEIKLEDEEGEPVPGQPYRVSLPDGSVAEGSLDGEGKARVEGFEPGNCNVTFPTVDKGSVKEK